MNKNSLGKTLATLWLAVITLTACNDSTVADIKATQDSLFKAMDKASHKEDSQVVANTLTIHSILKELKERDSLDSTFNAELEKDKKTLKSLK